MIWWCVANAVTIRTACAAAQDCAVCRDEIGRLHDMGAISDQVAAVLMRMLPVSGAPVSSGGVFV